MSRALGELGPPRIVVYTGIFGDYDTLAPIDVCSSARFVAFTDGDIEANGWEVLKKGKAIRPRRNARWHKCLPNVCLPQDTEYSIWIDGNIKMVVSPERIVDEWLRFHDVATFAHPSRQCVYREADAAINKGKAGHDAVKEQMFCYEEDGFPHYMGLSQTGVFVRRHTHRVKLFNFLWWDQINKHTNRDQLAVDYCMWKLGLGHFAIQGKIRRHPWFSYVKHRR